MIPTFFGSPPLFGIHHPPVRRPAGGRDAVLLCPPIGHEHTRCHRAFRVLSQALSRAGHHVLRFDYRGLGDSWGDPGEGGVEQWCDDIDNALGELAARSRTERIAVVGLRAGGLLAAAALGRHLAGRKPTVRRLVLWDPVLSGKEFLDNAADLQETFQSDPWRFPALLFGERSAEPPEAGSRLLGYDYPPAMREPLERLDLKAVEPWPAVATAFVLSRPSDECESLATRLRAHRIRVDSDVVAGADGAWEDYAEHEDTLRAGRLVPTIVGRLASGGR